MLSKKTISRTTKLLEGIKNGWVYIVRRDYEDNESVLAAFKCKPNFIAIYFIDAIKCARES